MDNKNVIYSCTSSWEAYRPVGLCMINLFPVGITYYILALSLNEEDHSDMIKTPQGKQYMT